MPEGAGRDPAHSLGMDRRELFATTAKSTQKNKSKKIKKKATVFLQL